MTDEAYEAYRKQKILFSGLSIVGVPILLFLLFGGLAYWATRDLDKSVTTIKEIEYKEDLSLDEKAAQIALDIENIDRTLPKQGETATISDRVNSFMRQATDERNSLAAIDNELVFFNWLPPERDDAVRRLAEVASAVRSDDTDYLNALTRQMTQLEGQNAQLQQTVADL